MARLSSREIVLQISAIDNASNKVNSVGAAVQRLQRSASFRQFGMGLVLTQIGRGFENFGKKILGWAGRAKQASMDFSYAMHLVQTQAQLPQRQFNKLTSGALRMSDQIGISSGDVASALYDVFSSLEVNYKQGLKIVHAAGKAAVGGGTDVKTALRSIVAELNAFGLGTNKINYLLDEQFQLVRKGIGTYSDFASAIYNLLPGAKAYNQSIKTINAEWSTMTKAGMSASQGSISVARAMDQLFRSSNAKKLKDTLGIDVFDQATKKYKQVPAIMQEIINKFKGLSEKQVASKFYDIFGAGEIRANRFFRIVLKRFPLLAQQIKFMGSNQVAGQAKKAFDIMADTPTYQWQKFTNALKNFGITVANTVMPEVRVIFGWLVKLGDWLNSLPKSTKRFIATAVILTGVISLLSGKVFVAVGRFLLLKGALNFFVGPGGFTSLITKVGLTIGVITGLIIAGYLLVKNWDKVVSWWKKNWHLIVTIAAAAAAAVVGFAIAKMITGMGSFLTTVRLTFMYALDAVKGFFTSVMAFVVRNPFALLVAVIAAAVAVIILNWGKMKGFFIGVTNGVIDAINFLIRGFNRISPIIGIIGIAIGAFTGNLAAAALGALALGSSVAGGIPTLGRLRDASDQAAGAMKTLAEQTQLYGDAEKRAWGETTRFSGSLKGLPAVAHKYANAIYKSGNASIDLGYALKIANDKNNQFNSKVNVQAHVIAVAVGMIYKHIKGIMSNRKALHDWGLTISTVNGLTIKQRSHIADLINKVYKFHGVLLTGQKAQINNIKNTKDYNGAIKMLKKSLEGAKGALKGTANTAAEVNAQIKGLRLARANAANAAEVKKISDRIETLKNSLKGVSGVHHLNLADNLSQEKSGFMDLFTFIDDKVHKARKVKLSDNAGETKNHIQTLVTLLENATRNPYTFRVDYKTTGKPGFPGTGGKAVGTRFWRGGWSWVGEHGPELAYLPRASRILTAMESRRAARGGLAGAGGGTTNVTNNIYAHTDAEPDDIIRELDWYRRTRGWS